MADIRVDIELKSGEKYSINNGRIDSLSSLTQSNSDASTIFYGVLSNTGSIDIADVNEEIKNLVEDEKLDYSGVKLDVFANGKQIQSHISGDSGYQDNLLNISLTDDLSNLSTTVYSNPEESNYLSDLTGLELLTKICEKSSPKINVPISGSNNLPYTESDMLNIYSYLNMIKFKDIDLSLGNMNSQELLNYFCNATQLNLFNSSNGDEVVIGARPVISDVKSSNLNNKPIFVKNKDVFENGERSLFIRNNFKQINIPFVDIAQKTGKYEAVSTENVTDYSNVFIDKNIYEKTLSGVPSDSPSYYYNDWYIWAEDVSRDDYIKFNDTLIVHAQYGSSHTALTNFKDLQVFNTIQDFYDSLDSINTSTSSFATHFSIGVLGQNFYQKSVNKYTVLYAIYLERYMPDMFPLTFWIGSGFLNSKDVNYEITEKVSKNYVASKSGDTVETKNIFDMQKNPLLTSTSTISVYGKDVPLYEYIAMNILNDYSRGIKTKTITIACSDLYYTHNPKLMAKNWANGDVLNIGDIINLETEKYRDGSYINWKTTGREFNFDGEPLLKAELQECKTIERLYNYLEDIKWSRVAEISQSGKAEQYFSVGDEKYIESVGATMVVLGFNHDEKTSGGKAGITFGLKFESYANGTRYYMQWAESSTGVPYNSNAGGWETSNARKYLNEDFINALPEDLRNSIVAVNKTTGIGGGSETTKVTSDKIWIPSEIEMTGSATYSASGEGTQYPYFNTAWTNGYKTWQRYYGVLRSPNLSNTSSMIKNPNTGESETSNSTNSYLFVNGFIGAIEPTSSFDQLVCFCI